jgi:caffeoyl-CoA O-methyltransferase
MADVSSRTGTRYANAEVLTYVERLHAPHDAWLESAFGAPAREGLPQIQVGPSEGKLVNLLLALIGPRRVVEIGTLAGYSALWIARALAADGHLWTFEREPKHRQLAEQLFREAGLGARVTCIEGDALTGLDRLASEHAPFDAVFIDADKGNYDRYGRFAAQHLRSGGLLLADNAYFFGKLLEDSVEARAMRSFHEEAAQAFNTVCIPTPDGLVLGVKR